MAIELDKDWPGLTVKGNEPKWDSTEIKRIAGELEESLKALKTPTQPPATSVAHAAGTTSPPLPGPPPGAGSLPDVRLQCAIGPAQLGEWLTAQQFAISVNTAYATLIGDTKGSGGVYSSLIRQYGAVIEAVLDIAKTNTAAEQANLEPGTRRDV
ncbi:hypothetical protein [Streptosporangium amethystogenes]|uniref:hypothetical protein n=1 Tax=Streptosporangium amethystogenes TaxID=2002 RepID=UPI0004C92FE6|nr:hypothetical protein [Streptosporangium amethystogenes]